MSQLRSAIALPSRPSLAACVVVLAALAGCKSMTDVQREAKIEAEIRDKLAIDEKERGEKAKAEMTEEEKRIEEELRLYNLRKEREENLRQASNALAQRRFDEALRIIEEILSPPPRKQYDEVAGRDVEIPQEPPILTPEEHAGILEIRALALNDLDRRDESIETFRKVVELDATRRAARKNLGRLLFVRGDFEEAVKVWELELADGYLDPDLLYLLAQAHYKIYESQDAATRDPGRLEAARFAMLTALLRNPTSVMVRRWLAFLEYESGRFEEAIRHFEAIRKVDPLDVQNLERLANACVQTKDYASAIDYLETAARLAEPAPRICRMLGDLYMQSDLYATAASWHARGYGDDPEKAPASERLLIGRLYQDGARAEDAVRWLAAVGDDAGDAWFDAQSSLAILRQSQGDEDAALACFENMQRARPQDCRAFLAAGDVWLERRELDRAFETYSKAAALDDCRADGLAGLAEVAYARGRLEEAVLQYERAIAARPDEKAFITARDQIAEEHRRRLAIAGTPPGTP